MAKRKRKKLYEKRAFLNADGGMAAVDAKVSVEDESTYTSVDATLTLSDCGNMIHLDFDHWSSSQDKKYLRLRRKKIALLRDTINDFLDAVEVAYNEVEENAEAKKAEAKRLAAEQKKKKK